MKKTVKILAFVLCAVMLVVGSVFGTYAYLTSQTETVKNTFTIGNVTITLDETDVDAYGVKDGDTRVTQNEYKLIPNHTYVKDPTIHVKQGSEVCYLFVKIVNGIADIEGTSTIANQLTNNGWTPVTGEAGVYVYNATIDAREAAADVDVKIFEYFTIAGTADVSTYATADNANSIINVTGYAVQADGFADSAAAWDAVKAAAFN